MQLVYLIIIAISFTLFAVSAIAIHYRLCELDKRQKEFVNEFSNYIKEFNTLNEGVEEDFNIIATNIDIINTKLNDLC